MSVFISDKYTAKLYVQFFRPKWPQIKILVQEWVDLYQRFWSCSKNSQSCIIRFNVHSCSFFKQNKKHKNLPWMVSGLATVVLTGIRLKARKDKIKIETIWDVVWNVESSFLWKCYMKKKTRHKKCLKTKARIKYKYNITQINWSSWIKL